MDPSFFDVELTELEERIWKSLGRAVADSRHDWHWPTLATVADGSPQMRTVVLRRASQGLLTFHTDLRTPKIEHLRQNRTISWHFYDASSRVQLRARGAVIEIDEDAREIWDELAPASRANYCASLTPGTRVDERTDGLDRERSAPTDENTEHGWPNFAVVRTRIDVLDWLWLSRGAHRRAIFDLEKDSSSWVIP